MNRVVQLAVLGSCIAACSSPNKFRTAEATDFNESVIYREALVESSNWVSIPAPLLPLLLDAEDRIAKDPLYDLSCLQFRIGYRQAEEDDDFEGYFVLVSHSEVWLRSNGHKAEADGEYRGGLSYCGSDVSFRYDRSGKFVEKVYQR